MNNPLLSQCNIRVSRWQINSTSTHNRCLSTSMSSIPICTCPLTGAVTMNSNSFSTGLLAGLQGFSLGKIVCHLLLILLPRNVSEIAQKDEQDMWKIGKVTPISRGDGCSQISYCKHILVAMFLRYRLSKRVSQNHDFCLGQISKK